MVLSFKDWPIRDSVYELAGLNKQQNDRANVSGLVVKKLEFPHRL